MSNQEDHPIVRDVPIGLEASGTRREFDSTMTDHADRLARKLHLLEVFATRPSGGNPAPIIADAAGMSDDEMQNIARSYELESGFVLPAPQGSDCDFEFRFWVPNHEMEMCGHATVGAVWLLRQLDMFSGEALSVATKSGRVTARFVDQDGDATVEISQPRGRVEALSDPRLEEDVLSVLGLAREDLDDRQIYNACTSRVKTLVPLKSVASLENLWPDGDRIEAVCDRIGSTDLYPNAVVDGGKRIFEARQFPKSSGYPEDAATGIAAAALAFGFLRDKVIEGDARPIVIRQGRAMRRPSEIFVRFHFEASGEIDGCWIGGPVRIARVDELSAGN